MCGLGARGGDTRGAVGRDGGREGAREGGARGCALEEGVLQFAGFVETRPIFPSHSVLYVRREKKVDVKNKKKPEESGEGEEEEEGFGVGSGNAKWICEPPHPLYLLNATPKATLPRSV